MATPKPLAFYCKAFGRAEIVEDPGTITENTCYFCADCSGKGRELWACRLCCKKDPCPYDVQMAIIKTTTEPLCQALPIKDKGGGLG